MNMIKHINNKDEFLNEIATGTTFVDFFATWCGPCKMLSPVIESLDNEGAFGDIKVVKVDVDEAEAIAMKYGIQSIPTLILFKDGKIANSALGYMGKNDLLKFIGK